MGHVTTLINEKMTSQDLSPLGRDKRSYRLVKDMLGDAYSQGSQRE